MRVSLDVAGRLEYMDGSERLPQDDEGNEAVRQVVQFAALRDVAGNPTALAAKLLQELPGQMLDWFGKILHCRLVSSIAMSISIYASSVCLVLTKMGC